VRTPRQETSADDGWTSEVSSGLALAGFLALVFLALTVLAMGPLAKFDAYFNLAPPPDAWLPTLHLMDRVGQRAVCLPILAVVTFLVCRRRRSWRPAVISAVAVFSLNLLVLMLKVGLGRGAPQAADPSFFGGGMAYPSGHSANIVLVYGLVGYLLMTYAQPGRRGRVFLWLLVPVLSVVMVIVSLTLNWHWFTDLVSGLLVGGVVLQVAASLDKAVPEAGFASRRWHEARVLLSSIRAGKSRGPANTA
jgi:membrane-associated phospholipid phosphatase